MCSMVLSTANFQDGDAVPYFFWDRNVTVAELRSALADRAHPRRMALLRSLLREARPDEVWSFVTPADVARDWDAIAVGLGGRRAFWAWLLKEWRDRGFLR